MLFAEPDAGFVATTAGFPSIKVPVLPKITASTHPHIPFLPIARDIEAAFTFAERARFPEHGLIVMGCRDEQSAPELMFNKDVTDTGALETAVREAVRRCGAAFVEADMRAHRNPTRMAAIGRATRDLARRFHSRCPNCDQPGFDVTERISGLPCAWCGEPTRVNMAEVLICQSCGHRAERSVATYPTTDPGQCDGCNP